MAALDGHGGESSDANKSATLKPCWVLVERLPAAGAAGAGHGADNSGSSWVAKPAAPSKNIAGLSGECRVLLERLDTAGSLSRPAPARPRLRPRPRQTKLTARAAALQDEAGQWLKRLRHGQRRQTAKRNVLHKKVALQVTQRSGKKRGRARGWTPTAAPRTRTASTSNTPVEHKQLYLSSFTELVKKLTEAPGFMCTFAEYETLVLQRWQELSEETGAVYLSLLGLRGAWIRGGYVPCKVGSIQEHFAALAQAGFVSNDLRTTPDLKQILELLRKDELETVAKDFIPKSTKRSKEALVRALQRYGAESPQNCAQLQARLDAALGGCVRVLAVPRQLVERVLLQQSAWRHAPLDGDRLRDARGLLLQRVPRLPRLAGPLWGGGPPPLRSMFTTRQQAVAWESLAHQRVDLGEAVTLNHLPTVANIAEDLLSRYNEHLAVCGVTEDIASRTLGTAFAEALTVASTALARSGEYDKRHVARTVLRALLGQRHHAQEKRAQWVVDCSRLEDEHKEAEMLISELADGGHRGAQRAHLEERAGILLRRKVVGDRLSRSLTSAGGGRLPEDLRSRLEGLLSPPLELPPVRVMKFTAMAGKTPSLKRVYVHQPVAGGKKQYLSVEERVAAKYAQSGEFPLGLDDEGETLVSLGVLAFWDAIYDGGVDDAWGSPCQDRPLDWATDRFWVARQMSMEERCQKLLQHATLTPWPPSWPPSWPRPGTTWPAPRAWCGVGLAAPAGPGGSPEMYHCTDVCGYLSESLERLLLIPIRVPDLLLWNPAAAKSLFVEVKGPGDALHLHQAQWLDFLRQSGAEGAVVEARS